MKMTRKLTALLLALSMLFSMIPVYAEEPAVEESAEAIVETAEEILETAEEPVPEAAEEPVPEPEVEPAAPAEPEEQLPEVAEEPVAEATEEPTPEAAEEPVAEVTEEPVPEATEEPAEQPIEMPEEPAELPTEDEEPEATDAVEEEFTAKVSEDLSFAFGYVRVAGKANAYANADLSEAVARYADGSILLAVDRVHAGQSKDALMVAFQTDDGIRTAYVKASALYVLTEGELADYQEAAANSNATVYYENDHQLPLMQIKVTDLTAETVATDEPAEEQQNETPAPVVTPVPAPETIAPLEMLEEPQSEATAKPTALPEEKAPLAAPVLNVPASLTSQTCRISWSTVSGATDYIVYTATDPNGPWKQWTTTKTNPVNGSVVFGKVNYFKVAARLNGVEGKMSNVVSVFCLATPVISDFRQKTSDPSVYQINFKTIANVDGYYVYRSNSASGTFTRIATVAKDKLIANGTDYALIDLPETAEGTKYFYQIQGYHKVENVGFWSSARSAAKSFTRLAAPVQSLPASLSSLTTKVIYSAVSGAKDYIIMTSLNPDAPHSSWTKWATTTATRLEGNITFGQVNYFKIAARDENGVPGTWSNVLGMFGMATPYIVGFQQSDTKPGTWQAKVHTVANATGYVIYRSSTANGTFDRLTKVTLSETTAVDANTILIDLPQTPEGSACYYQVQAYHSEGTGLWSSLRSSAKSFTRMKAPIQSLPASLSSLTTKVIYTAVSGAKDYVIYTSLDENAAPDQWKLWGTTTDTRLEGNITFGKVNYFKIAARDANGVTGTWSNILGMFGMATPGITSMAPAAGPDNQITMNIRKVANATGYYVYRGSSADGPFERIYNSNGNNDAILLPAQPNGTWYYQVQAYHKESNGSWSSLRGTAFKWTYSALAAPTISGVSALNQSSAKVAWNAVSGASSYKVYIADAANGPWMLWKTATATNVTGNVAAGSVHYFTVCAVGSSGAAGKFSAVKDIFCLNTPVINGVSYSPLRLTIADVLYATEYKVLRSNAANGSWTTLETVSCSQVTDHMLMLPDVDVQTGANWYYAVEAIHTENGKSWTSARSAAFNSMCTTLIAPEAGTLTVDSTIAVTLSWTGMDVANTTGYYILLDATENGSYSRIATVNDPNAVSCTVAHQPGAECRYAVQAYKISGSNTFVSEPTLIGSASTQLAAPLAVSVVCSNNTLELNWQPPQDDAILGYHILRSESEDGEYIVLHTVEGAETASAELTIEPGMAYWYAVQAYTNVNGTVFTSERTVLGRSGVMEKPELWGFYSSIDLLAVLNWTAVPDAGAYLIRKNVNGVWQQIGEVSAVEADDVLAWEDPTPFEADETRMYRVFAVDAAGMLTESESDTYALFCASAPHVESVDLETGLVRLTNLDSRMNRVEFSIVKDDAAINVVADCMRDADGLYAVLDKELIDGMTAGVTYTLLVRAFVINDTATGTTKVAESQLVRSAYAPVDGSWALNDDGALILSWTCKEEGASYRVDYSETPDDPESWINLWSVSENETQVPVKWGKTVTYAITTVTDSSESSRLLIGPVTVEMPVLSLSEPLPAEVYSWKTKTIEAHLEKFRSINDPYITMYTRLNGGEWTSTRVMVPGMDGTATFELPTAEVGTLELYFSAIEPENDPVAVWLGSADEPFTVMVMDQLTEENEVTYQYVDGSMIIKSYNGNASSLTIPEMVEGVAVTVVGDSAFEGNTTLASIDLPDSITVIGKRAFAGCTSLANMN